MKKIILILVIALVATIILANNSWETCLQGENIRDLRQSHNMIYGVTKNQFFKSNNGLNFEINNVSLGDSLELETLSSVSMLSSSRGYIVGSKQTTYSYHTPLIYKTSNGGISWQEGNSPFDNVTRTPEIEVSFVGYFEGYLVVNDDTDMLSPYLRVYQTVDAGYSWDMVWSIPLIWGERYRYSDFSSYPKIIVSSHRSFTSVDGLNWQPVNLPNNTLRTSLASNNGRLILFNSNDNENKLYYSNNLGSSWQESDFSTTLYNYYFAANNSWLTAQANHLFAAIIANGHNYNICYFVTSHNNGGSWQWFDSFLPSAKIMHKIIYWGDYLYVFFANQNDDRYIFRTYVGPPVSNNDLIAPIAEANCFPNPFRKTTKLKLDIKQTDNEPTTVFIYNIKGQLVYNLLNDYLTFGQHEINWAGQDNQGNLVSPGIYFFKIKSGKFSSTKKVILVK